MITNGNAMIVADTAMSITSEDGAIDTPGSNPVTIVANPNLPVVAAIMAAASMSRPDARIGGGKAASGVSLMNPVRMGVR
jgi:hypothetical protein